jgi:hypothetical protein
MELTEKLGDVPAQFASDVAHIDRGKLDWSRMIDTLKDRGMPIVLHTTLHAWRPDAREITAIGGMKLGRAKISVDGLGCGNKGLYEEAETYLMFMYTKHVEPSGIYPM